MASVKEEREARAEATDVPAFNQLVRDANIPAIVVKPPSGP